MRQVCPTCNRDVGDDNMCAICGPVSPIVVEFDAQEAAANRAAGKAVPRGAQAGPGGAANALVSMVLLVIVLCVAWVVANELFNDKQGVDKDEVAGVLRRTSQAFRDNDAEQLKALVAELKQLAPTSRAPREISGLARVMSEKKPDGTRLASAFAACEWLNTRSNFPELNDCGMEAKSQLEKKVAALISRGIELADQGRYEDAMAILDSVPKASEHYEDLGAQRAQIGQAVAKTNHQKAKDALANGDPIEAERLIDLARESAIGDLRPVLLKMRTEVRALRAKRARELYRTGDVETALRMLSTLQNEGGLVALKERIEQVAEMARRAEQMTAEGSAGTARITWQKIIDTEKDSGNYFVQKAKKALGQ